MKKIICILLTLLLILSMAVPALAVTPKLEVPDLPETPEISDDVRVELPESFWESWFADHPVLAWLKGVFRLWGC